MTGNILLVFVFFASANAFAQSAFAQAVPADPLQAICTGFLAQSGVGITGDQNKLCACLVDEAQKQLTREDMEAFSQAMAGGQQPQPEVMQKAMNVATTCLTQTR